MMQSSSRSAWLVLAIPLFVAGCGGFKIWPFGEDEKPRMSRGPENATEYRCDAGKVFHVRYLDAGKSAWLILPDRQVRLDRLAGDTGTRYSNGIADLRVNGDEAALTDGPVISYSGCKAGIAVKP
jgi:membrane-bound inhibitor of C-type lysozyme